MAKPPRVKVTNTDEDQLGMTYCINEQEIRGIKALDFRVSVEEVPTFTFETMGLPEIDMLGDIRFSFTPQTVTEAINVLRCELMKDDDLYRGFLASIKSGIAESATSDWGLAEDAERALDYTAECVIRRIIGEA